MIDFCKEKFPFPLPIIVLTNNDLWIQNIYITDIIPLLFKPQPEKDEAAEEDHDPTPIALHDIDTAEIELEIPITPMFNIFGECAPAHLEYRTNTDILATDGYGWHSVQ